MSERPGGPSRCARAGAAVLVATVLAAACGGTGGQSSVDEPAATTAAASAPAVEVATSPAPPVTTPAVGPTDSVPATTPPATTPPATAPPATTTPPVAAAVAVWQRAVTAVAGGGTDPGLSAAGTDALRGLVATLTPPLTFATVATVGPEGSVAIDDCVLGTATEIGARRVRGTVSPTGEVAAVATTRPGGGCVPAAVNAEVLEAYAGFWDAFAAFGAPADPDHPGLAATTTGTYTETLRAVLGRFAADGREFRGRPQLRPEVEAYLAPDRVRIGDCQIMPASFGVYAAATGERTTDWPPVRDGQTDFRSVTLRRVDGVWKVEGVRDETDSPCPYPSPRAAAVVGPAA